MRTQFSYRRVELDASSCLTCVAGGSELRIDSGLWPIVLWPIVLWPSSKSTRQTHDARGLHQL